MPYTEAGKRATIKYKKAHLKRIPLEVSFDEAAEIKEAADRAGEAVNSYIRGAIRERMKKEGGE